MHQRKFSLSPRRLPTSQADDRDSIGQGISHLCRIPYAYTQQSYPMTFSDRMLTSYGLANKPVRQSERVRYPTSSCSQKRSRF